MFGGPLNVLVGEGRKEESSVELLVLWSRND